MAFFDNIRFPFFTMQELNLDWILKELKRIAGFMPQDGNPGDVLTRKSDGSAWEPPEAVNININALPEDTEIGDNDQLVFYDISAQANRKIKPPNMLDSMMSNGIPLMDGTGSAGTSKKPARYDHKHPTDTSRQAALSGAQMNAVNSGAPANAFNNGALKIEAGGTNADNAADARYNLGLSYKTGDVFSLPESATTAAAFAGYVFTTSEIRILLYTDKYMESTPTVTAVTGRLCNASGIIDGTSVSTDYINDPDWTVNLKKISGTGITIELKKNAAISGLAQATSAILYGRIVLSF